MGLEEAEEGLSYKARESSLQLFCVCTQVQSRKSCVYKPLTDNKVNEYRYLTGSRAAQVLDDVAGSQQCWA